MVVGNVASVLRPVEGIASAIGPGSRRLMAVLAQRAGTSDGDVSTTVRKQPSMAFALLTLLLGVVLATWRARSSPGRRTLRHRLGHARRQLKAALDLPPLMIKLLANPIIQDYLRRRVLREVSRNLGR